MAFINIDDLKKTSIEEIDLQHETLVEIINEFHETFQNFSSREQLLKILSRLQDYADYHFKTEENLFNKAGYASAEEHIAEHNQFIERVRSFYNGYSAREIQISYKVMTFIRSWISNHINKSDQDYVKHITDH